MKIYALCFATFLLTWLVPLRSDAQRIEEIGLKAGIIYAAVTETYEIDHGIKSPSVGGYVSFGFTRRLGLQVELLYLTNGWAYDSYGTSIEFELHYLQMPILGKVAPVKNQRIDLAFLFGPTFARKLSQTLPFGSEDFNPDLFYNHHFDAGFTLGGDLGIKISQGTLIFASRYYWGMTKIINTKKQTRNRSFTLMLGYAL